MASVFWAYCLVSIFGGVFLTVIICAIANVVKGKTL
jgi:hypothetical protein